MSDFWDSFTSSFMPMYAKTLYEGIEDNRQDKKWLERQQTIMDIRDQEEQKAIDAYSVARDKAKAQYGLVEDTNEMEERQFGDTIITLPKLKTAEEKKYDDMLRETIMAQKQKEKARYDYITKSILNPQGTGEGVEYDPFKDEFITPEDKADREFKLQERAQKEKGWKQDAIDKNVSAAKLKIRKNFFDRIDSEQMTQAEAARLAEYYVQSGMIEPKEAKEMMDSAMSQMALYQETSGPIETPVNFLRGKIFGLPAHRALP